MKTEPSLLAAISHPHIRSAQRDANMPVAVKVHVPLTTLLAPSWDEDLP
jgi:hypothetical protein